MRMKVRKKCEVCKRKTRHNRKGECINHITNKDSKKFSEVTR